MQIAFGRVRRKTSPAAVKYQTLLCSDVFGLYYKYHRDGVGAINLWQKVSGFLLNPVVGEMAAPVGVKFKWHLCRSG